MSPGQPADPADLYPLEDPPDTPGTPNAAGFRERMDKNPGLWVKISRPYTTADALVLKARFSGADYEIATRSRADANVDVYGRLTRQSVL